MSGIAYRSMVTEGDRWLEQSVETFRNGGGVQTSTAEAVIAQAYYARAALEKPDTLASLLAAGAAAKGAQGQPATDDVDAAMERHPAGSKLPHEQPRRIVDNPQA